MNKNEEKIEIEKITELLRKGETDDGTFYGSLYDLQVLIRVAQGIDNINKGNFISLEELHKEMEELYERTIRESNKARNC